MAVYQYVNAEREFVRVVVGGEEVREIPPNDQAFFAARPEEEMEVYARASDSASALDSAEQLTLRLVRSGKVGELALRLRPV
jgi:hypothetical protein